MHGIEPDELMFESDEDFDEDDDELAGELDEFEEPEYYTHLRDLQVCINLQSHICIYAHRSILVVLTIVHLQDVVTQLTGTHNFDEWEMLSHS